MVSLRDDAFIGVVVNPKTKAPIYVVRPRRTERTIDIFAAEEAPFDVLGSANPIVYEVKGTGYLNDDRDYAGPTEVSGLPRSHTPSGVGEKGSGYGTALYTALALLATAGYEREITLPNLIGRGPGVSSTPSDDTRSESADAWWSGSLRRGLTNRTTGYTTGGDEDEEEESSGSISDYVNLSGRRRIERLITDEIEMNGDWRLRNWDLSVEVVKDVSSGRSSEKITVDTYRYASAVSHKLIAVRDVSVGDVMTWAGRHTSTATDVHKDVILALNVSREDLRVVGRLAILAREGGATESEIAAFLMRNRLGVDVTSRKVTFERPVVPVATPVKVRPRVAPRGELVRRPGDEPPVPNPPLIAKRNPPPAITASDRRAVEGQLAELEQRRADLGWDTLEDL